tara:strand:- start:221 stop:406 length:186 start_codon:yes stop_codon:yes gene_type:complete
LVDLKKNQKKFGGLKNSIIFDPSNKSKMEQIQNEGGKTLDRLVNLVTKLVNKLKSIIIKNN